MSLERIAWTLNMATTVSNGHNNQWGSGLFSNHDLEKTKQTATTRKGVLWCSNQMTKVKGEAPTAETSIETQQLPQKLHLSLRFLSLLRDLDRFFLSSPIFLEKDKTGWQVEESSTNSRLPRPKRCGALRCSSGADVHTCHNIFKIEKTR